MNLFGVAATSPTTAFAVGDLGTVLRTKDGSTWERLAFDATTYADDNVPDRILNGVVFTSPTEGLIGGEFATLLRTHDGGETWVGTRQLTGAPADLYLFNISAGGGSAAAVGLAGGVLVGNADGSEWTSRSVDTSAGLFAIAWQGEHGITAGDRGVLFVTSDGGATWTEAKRPKLFNWIGSATLRGRQGSGRGGRRRSDPALRRRGRELGDARLPPFSPSSPTSAAWAASSANRATRPGASSH